MDEQPGSASVATDLSGRRSIVLPLARSRGERFGAGILVGIAGAVVFGGPPFAVVMLITGRDSPARWRDPVATTDPFGYRPHAIVRFSDAVRFTSAYRNMSLSKVPLGRVLHPRATFRALVFRFEHIDDADRLLAWWKSEAP